MYTQNLSYFHKKSKFFIYNILVFALIQNSSFDFEEEKISTVGNISLFLIIHGNNNVFVFDC